MSSRASTSGQSMSAEYQEQAKGILVQLVTSLLRDKPKDPVSLE
jgi:hypothetical protein